jgi:hypothetical protein
MSMRTKKFSGLALVAVLAMAGCAAPTSDVEVASSESALTVFWVDGTNEVTADVEVTGPECQGTQGVIGLTGTFTALEPATVWLIMTLDGPPPAAEIIVAVDADFVPAGRDWIASFDELLPVPDGSHTLDFCFALDDGRGAPSSERGCLSTIPSNLSCNAPSDTTPPTIVGSRSPGANVHGWNNTDVTASFVCDDAESGIVSCTAPVTLSGEGANQSVTGTAVNGVGLSASATVSSINIDKTAPTVSFGGTGTYEVSDTVNVTCSANDTLSGIASSTCSDVSGAAYSFGAGTHAVSASATDKADNVGNGSGSFTVVVTTEGLCELFGQFSSSKLMTKLVCAKLGSIQHDLDHGKHWLAKIKIFALRFWLHAVGRSALSSSELSIFLGLLDEL